MSKPKYQQSLPAIYQELGTDQQGLSQAEAKARLEKYGHNALNQQKSTTLVQKFLAQFKDFMIIVLLAAALIAAFTGEVVDAVIILLVVVLNAVFGVFQEAKAEEAINALKEMAAPDATVLRDGELQTVKSDELVPGDVVTLEAGDIVPADLRLLESASLKVEESALTGESVPVEKDANMILSDDELAIGDRLNLAYMNSNVTYGRATGMVVATGMQTEVGRIAGMIEAADETTTPLQANLMQLGKSLTILILIIAAVVFGIGMLRGSESLVNMLLTAISLAVAAIPEGLPAIVTITLALGTQRMAKRHALVRKLPAVETLGSTDIIASDKTGTLTQNKMTVEKLYVNQQLVDAHTADLATDSTLAQVMILSNDTKIMADGLAGDPTETALVQYNLDQGYPVNQLLTDRPRVSEVPFDSERKLMSTVHPLANGQFLVAVKGAPDELLKRVTQVEVDGQPTAFTKPLRDQILATNHDLATQALRVLAFAYKVIDVVPTTVNSETLENDLVFAGMVGMIDPERPEVEQAVAEAKSAGIRPLMITGDHRDTAEAIAARLGIIEAGDDAAVITGAELDAMSDAEFGKKVGDYSVYARVAPEHKVRIVNAWQKRGKVVAMTGDGVNDAPALKAADIGIGMGITGTEVSKGASDMVLADDNFATIVVAVEEGRKVFANIQKAIQYLLSANLGEVLTLFMMTMLGWQILAPVHILWINLVTDTLPAIALGVEPTEKNIMDQKPRGRQSNFFSGGVFSSIIYQGLLEGGLTLFVYWIAITYPVHANASLAHADALTMAFATLGLIQLFHAFNSKSIHGSLFTVGLFRNKFFNWAILIAFALLAMTIVVPGFNDLFHVTHLDAFQWAIVAAAGIAMVVIVEIVKFIQRRVLK
ncbi:cation-translocating P-type ATPase [Lactiplantibacillus mudanjiangensis]|uniref:P-type Ca(2+) transporter n=1 Tax=Lactiplantibacillus mudanjiangensis TaxID=1296538 RepID=A0A660E815_9LACO|nr:cation-translocating P-type ATPase [Lactiplantibacillus mudanjiangensis]VDG18068.1 Cation transporting P-type ATPase [Lactobacillus plantarum ZJ316] [Lactiplantibacillus mudanjiangensis]VDG24762.1 Cation transporting P-type ATPase [Lactobacillus plantarum ZJ316] [Lactiplantibacillus mudanjiangensis]VDG28489.1 Cation transporting P-type ATPase [Lactobacillus plantarum ZJ316] [Lactiplantibacillus mudanjiangensis]